MRGAGWAVSTCSGEVVGTGYLSGSNFHAFLYTCGKMTDIGPPGSLQASADAINNSSQIVGSYYLTSGGGGAFLYSNGKMTTLPVPAGASSVSALAINDNGEIAGAPYPSSGGAAHAARYVNGFWSDLGTIAGAASNVGMGINLSGQVVGTAIFPQNAIPSTEARQARSLHIYYERPGQSEHADSRRCRLHAY